MTHCDLYRSYEFWRYAWDQAKNGKVKIYVMLEDLPIAGEFTEQDVIVEFPDEWSVDVTVRAGCGSTMNGSRKVALHCTEMH